MVWRRGNFASRRWTAWAGAALLCAALLAAGSASAQGERRVALVIGESRYRNVPALPNTFRDAQLLAKTLQGLGFDVVGGKALTDLDRPGFEQAIRTFRESLSGATVGLFYYAGHGLQVDGENYLVPVDANLSQIADMDFELIDANLVLRQMNAAGTRLNIVLLDACRNNPFADRSVRGVGGGLAQMQAPKGTLISYAAEPGKLAQDGPEGGNGPYALALAEAVVKPGEDLFQVFNDVGIIVDRLTNGLQRPWVTSSPIEGRFYFATAPATGLGAPSRDDMAVEIAFWDSVREANDGAMFESYLERYPKGAFAPLARRRIQLLSGQASLAPREPASRPTPAAAATQVAKLEPSPSQSQSLPALDGVWRGILACGEAQPTGSRNATGWGAYTANDLELRIKDGAVSGERSGVDSHTSNYAGNPGTQVVFAESYEGSVSADGAVQIAGHGQVSVAGRYAIELHGKIRPDGDLEAAGTVGYRTCTMDYQHAQP